MAFLNSCPGRQVSVEHLEGQLGLEAGVGGYMMSSVLSSVNLARGLYLGNLGFVGGRHWYPGSDRGPPGEGTPREEHQESGEKPSSGSGAGEEVKQPRGVREGTSEGRKPRTGKQGLQERLPHRAARRRDAHQAWCQVRMVRPPRLEPRPAWKLCLAQLKLLNSYRDGEPKTFSHQPTSFLGCPPAPP